ncbi:MAG: 8-oxo-dGTP diphosphatase [Candidatus Paceibacteria bacterium]|jgi:8-oxo-dGTP diphosphatase
MAEVIVVNRCFTFNEDGLILSIQRAKTDRHNPGLWEVPGGKLEEGQDLHGALEREIIEETGFLIRSIDSLAHFESSVLGSDSNYSGTPYIVLFGLAEIIGGELTLSHEHDDSCWCTYEDFMKFDLTLECRKAAIVLKDRLVAMRVG